MGRYKYVYVNKPRMSVDEDGLRFDLNSVLGYSKVDATTVKFMLKNGEEATSVHDTEELTDKLMRSLDKYYNVYDLDHEDEEEEDDDV